MTKTDQDAIREIELRFNEAWGRHDPDGMAESLVDDANFVTVNGAWTQTRADFRDLMQRLHGPNGPFRSSTRETPQMDVRFLAPDIQPPSAMPNSVAMSTIPSRVPAS